MSSNANHPALILASASPRRRELLHEAGFDFLVHPADVDEDDYPPTILPADLAQHLANVKADEVSRRFPDHYVLAADTVVALGDMILGKPRDEQHAREMLSLLSGTTHIVITGVTLVSRAHDFRRGSRSLSSVRMSGLSDEQIDAYIKTRLWEGKAGGYGIQDNDPFVTCQHGSHTNIVGLPMELATRFLGEAGIKPRNGKSASVLVNEKQ